MKTSVKNAARLPLPTRSFVRTVEHRLGPMDNLHLAKKYVHVAVRLRRLEQSIARAVARFLLKRNQRLLSRHRLNQRLNPHEKLLLRTCLPQRLRQRRMPGPQREWPTKASRFGSSLSLSMLSS